MAQAGETALLRAVGNDQGAAIKTLLAAKADTNAKNEVRGVGGRWWVGVESLLSQFFLEGDWSKLISFGNVKSLSPHKTLDWFEQIPQIRPSIKAKKVRKRGFSYELNLKSRWVS